MAAKRKKHSKEYKWDAVALSYKSEKSMTEIADDFGIHRSVLVRWRKEFDEYGENAFPGNGLRKLSPTEEENLRLKKSWPTSKKNKIS